MRAAYIHSFIESQKMSGATGGIQGEKGTLFGEPYAAGSWQDKLIEAFAGRKVMNITAENIKNLGGTLSADNLNAVARLDIDNTGGTIEALFS
jgi:hypothetical protein